MVINSLALNLAQVLDRVLALTAGIRSKDLFPLQRIPPYTCLQRVVLSAPP